MFRNEQYGQRKKNFRWNVVLRKLHMIKLQQIHWVVITNGSFNNIDEARKLKSEVLHGKKTETTKKSFITNLLFSQAIQRDNVCGQKEQSTSSFIINKWAPGIFLNKPQYIQIKPLKPVLNTQAVLKTVHDSLNMSTVVHMQICCHVFQPKAH